VKRLGLDELTDEHLRLIKDAEGYGETQAEDWIMMAGQGQMEIWEHPEGGIIGLRKDEKRLYIDFLAGKKLVNSGLREWLRERADGLPIEGCVMNPRLIPLYARLGARVIGTYMRIV
jgi:hypothetical protein